ncbi:hypothetical protein P152DRAFT_482244 [Eremomyces bilateralis CBS 781.70]|uniref:CENP-V/GFA domain-containing protein n=1 Tax=Eremomyces bilateralis CBS 781.70 TaxID=1392243 RepID=A0A6G1G2P4_9PEZI|nr:uncharacterized protein P152DRAFT_482244 [Eremomyces bilateralis CBS 781.70]KAF1812196.1 hypothetical protein P152DRAFT_482244 [Eremomyces bilateralis CBS 781.70]
MSTRGSVLLIDGEPCRSLNGVCACTRNSYVVNIPEPRIKEAQVQFDTSSSNRRHQAAPFSAFLRVPLDWFHSTTTGFFSDETHTSIRRTYDAPNAPEHTRRQFCGYCGTPLSVWSESTREDADFINLTLESLVDGEISVLEELGLLPSGEEEEEVGELQAVRASSSGEQLVARKGSPWFEEMVDDGRLGRVKRQRGGHMLANGRPEVEWEVVEFTNGDESGRNTPSKRKIGQMSDDMDR